MQKCVINAVCVPFCCFVFIYLPKKKVSILNLSQIPLKSTSALLTPFCFKKKLREYFSLNRKDYVHLLIA